MKTPKISIIIPVIGKDETLLSCLDSARKLDYPQGKIEVILVDNGLDKNIKNQILKIKKKNRLDICLVGNKKNIGFAGAVNLGLKKAKGEWIFVTNSDVVFDRKSVFELVKIGDSDSKIGVLGPMVYSLAKKSKISDQDMPGFGSDFFWGRVRSLSIEKLARLKSPIEVDWVSGSGMMIKKEVTRKIGFLEERFFAYWEDADFGTRIKRVGYKVVLVPSAKIYHQGSVVLGKTTPEKVYYLSRNSLLFLFGYSNFAGKIRLHLRNLVLVLVKLIKAIFGIKKEENLAIVAGILDFYKGKFGKRKK